MSTYEFSVPCLFGLEGIAGDELRRLDIPNVRVENGRVLFSGRSAGHGQGQYLPAHRGAGADRAGGLPC